MARVPLRASPVLLVLAIPLQGLPGQVPKHTASGEIQTHPRGALVARVGAHEIRERDLLAELNRQIPLIYYHRRVPPEKIEEMRQLALDKLVEKSLIHQDAVARGITATADEVRAEFEKTLRQAGRQYANVSDAEFTKLLARYRPQVERRVLLDKNEARFRAALPEITPDSLKAVYDRMLVHERDALMSPPAAHLQHIFIAADPSSTQAQFEAKRKRAEAARQEVEDGKPFAEVARLYSEDEFAKKGGDLGVVGRGSFRSSKIDKAAFALQPGELSPVLRSLYGYHVVRCVKVRPRQLSPLEDVEPMLTAWLEKEHRQQARKAWMEQMRTRFPVKILEPEASDAKPAPEQKTSLPPDAAGQRGQAGTGR